MENATKTIASESTRALRNFFLIISGGAGFAGLMWLGYEIYDLVMRVNEQGVAQALLR